MPPLPFAHSVLAIQADLAQAASAEAMVAGVVDALGPPGVLANNAGASP